VFGAGGEPSNEPPVDLGVRQKPTSLLKLTAGKRPVEFRFLEAASRHCVLPTRFGQSIGPEAVVGRSDANADQIRDREGSSKSILKTLSSW